MKNLTKLIFTIAFVFTLSACDSTVERVTDEQIEQVKTQTRYFKDHKGICWGLIQTGKAGNNNSGFAGGIVDCEKVGL